MCTGRVCVWGGKDPRSEAMVVQGRCALKELPDANLGASDARMMVKEKLVAPIGCAAAWDRTPAAPPDWASASIIAAKAHIANLPFRRCTTQRILPSIQQ